MDLFHGIKLEPKDVVLSFNSTHGDIWRALIVWDMPLEAYPSTLSTSTSFGLSTSYKLPIKRKLGEADVVVGDDITVHLVMQTVVIPSGNGNDYSCWNAKDFPRGDLCMPGNNADGHLEGHSHTSAKLAWLHALQISHKQWEFGPLPLVI